MWQASEMLEMIKRDATSYGIYPHVSKFNFTELVDSNTLIFTHSLSKGLDSNNVEVIHGYAQFVDNHGPTSTMQQTF